MLTARPDGGAVRCGFNTIPDNVYYISLQTYAFLAGTEGPLVGASDLGGEFRHRLAQHALLYTFRAPTSEL